MYAINFAASDIYGGVFGTTELTIPEANDQKALVDDQKASAEVAPGGRGKLPIGIAIIVIVAVVALGGFK